MRTTKKEVTNAIKATIFEALNLEEQDRPNTATELIEVFKGEYLHHNNRHRPEQDNFIDWLQGLPSAISLPYYYDEIIELMTNKWFLPQPEGKTDQDSAKLFYYLIYREVKNLQRQGK